MTGVVGDQYPGSLVIICQISLTHRLNSQAFTIDRYIENIIEVVDVLFSFFFLLM